MAETLLLIVQFGIILFIVSGIAAIVGRLSKKESLHQIGLMLMVISGPATLFVCWEAQEAFRASNAVFWGRLMAGDVSKIWGIGSLGIIAGSGFAIGALSLNRKGLPLFLGAFFFAAAILYSLYSSNSALCADSGLAG